MKRMLSLFVTLALLMTSFPLPSLAEATDTSVETQQVTQAPENTLQTTVQETPAVTETPAAEETETPAAEPPLVQETEQPTNPNDADATQTPAPEETAVLLSADATSLTFDALVVDYQTATPLPFTLRNDGDAEANLQYPSLASFVVEGPATLAAGASATVKVTPKTGLTVGDYAETLTITGGESTVSVRLSVAVQAQSSASLMAMGLLATDSSTLLPAPTWLAPSVAAYNAITLSWTEVTGATGYKLYKVASGANIWIADVPTTGTATATYTVTNLTCGTLYSFKVRAYDASSNLGAMTPAAVTAKPVPPAPEGITAVSTGMRSNRITWTINGSDKGTSGYYLYMSDTADGTYTQIATITSRTSYRYDHTNLTPGTTYYYKIAAYNINPTNNYVGGALSSTYAFATPVMPTVVNFTAESLNAGTIRLKWNKVADATGYVIERYSAMGGSADWTKSIDVNTTLSYDDSDQLYVGQLYYYSIKAYLNVLDVNYMNKQVFGVESEASAKPLPTAPTYFKAVPLDYNKVQLTWTEASDATGYYIYRSSDGESEHVIAELYKTNSYVDSNLPDGLETGKAYHYRISSRRNNGDVWHEGAFYKDSLTARPRPEQVTNLVVDTDTYNSLVLTWDACEGAEQYQVEISTSSGFSGSTTRVETTENTTYTVANLTCGRLYYFRITSMVESADAIVTKGIVSGVKYGRAVPQPPSSFTLSYTSSSNVRIAWSAASTGASGYYIKRSTDLGGPYTTVGIVPTGTQLYYVNGGLITAQTYYYKVSAFVVYGGVRYEGESSDYQSIKALPGKPVISSVTSVGSTSLKVTWGMVTGATGYTLFYSNTEDGIFKEVPILYGSQTSYTLTDLVATGETTYVKVQANVLYNDVVEVGVMSDVATGVALPKKVTGLTVTAADANSLKLTWTLQQVAGNMADGYYVYSCDKSGHVIGRIADIESGDTNTYTDPDLTVGEYNYYVVCAYATSASGFMEGERSDPRGAIVLPTTPKNLALEVSGYNSITLTWDAVSDATGYEVYYSTNNITFTNLRRITDNTVTTFTHTPITSGRMYYYRVRSYQLTGISYRYSSFSDSLGIAAKPEAPTNLAVSTDEATGNPLLTWTKAAGATTYLVYYDTDDNGPFENYRVISGSASSTIISGLTVGKTYYFKVKARVIYNGVSVPSDAFTDKVHVTVYPRKPIYAYVSPVNFNTVRVTWYGVQGAVGYKVFARDEGGDLILSQTVTGATSLTLSDNRLSGQYVNYTVAAYCNDYNTGAELYGAESKAARLKVQLYAPANVTATVIDSDTVSISWAAVANAEGYRISRKVGTATTFTEMEIIKTPDTRQCFDAKLVSDVDIAEKVVYQVEAWLDSAEADAYGAPKTSNTIYRVPAIPQNMTATAADYKTINLSWNATEGAMGYQVQMSTVGADSGFYTIKTLVGGDTTTYADLSRNLNTTYYYRVKAYIKTASGVYYYGLPSDVDFATPFFEAIDSFAADNAGKSAIKFTWDKTVGAVGYRIYYKKSANTDYVTLLNYSPSASIVTGITYTKRGLTSGVSYDFYIVPYRVIYGRVVMGPISDIITLTVE